MGEEGEMGRETRVCTRLIRFARNVPAQPRNFASEDAERVYAGGKYRFPRERLPREPCVGFSKPRLHHAAIKRGSFLLAGAIVNRAAAPRRRFKGPLRDHRHHRHRHRVMSRSLIIRSSVDQAVDHVR